MGAQGLWIPALVARLAALTGLALVIDAFNFTLLFAAVGVSVPTLKAMAAYPALLLSFAVPAGPGYVGNLEVAGALVLGGGLGLGTAVSAGAIVLYHAITAANALALGLVSFLLIGGLRGSRGGGEPTVTVGTGIGHAAEGFDVIDPPSGNPQAPDSPEVNQATERLAAEAASA